MAEVSSVVKLQILAGKANPAPPIGSTLGQRQVNIMEFCKQFNERTKSFGGVPCPVIITIYKDKTFSFVVKQPPVSYFIKQLIGKESGAKMPGREVIAKIKASDLIEFVKLKIVDMNCFDDLNTGVSMFIGTARSMGVEVVNDI